MRSTPVRFMNAMLWPFTIWMSLTRLEEHPADDYVGRTSPIAAFAIAFWICVAGLASMWFAIYQGQMRRLDADGVEYSVRVTQNGLTTVFEIVALFTIVVYAIGFWLFSTRDERYPR